MLHSMSVSQQEREELGSWLSLALGCPVYFRGEKNVYSCHCGLVFPFYLVRQRSLATLILFAKQLGLDIDCPVLQLKKKETF